MALVVPLAQLTAAFPPITQVYSVCCPAISSLHLLCSPSGSQALFHSSKRQRHRCCYLNFLACKDGQQREFAF